MVLYRQRVVTMSLKEELVKKGLVNKTTIIMLKTFLIILTVLFVVLIYKQGQISGMLSGCPQEIKDCCFNNNFMHFVEIQNQTYTEQVWTKNKIDLPMNITEFNELKGNILH
jgi:hypothetical protein